MKYDLKAVHFLEILDFTEQATMNLDSFLIVKLMMEHDSYLWGLLEVSLHLTQCTANR
jgi:hypothetical protein